MEEIIRFDKGTAADRGGRLYRRTAIRTHFVTPHTDKAALVRQYVLPLAQPGDMLFISAQVLSLCEGLTRTRGEARLIRAAAVPLRRARGL